MANQSEAELGTHSRLRFDNASISVEKQLQTRNEDLETPGPTTTDEAAPFPLRLRPCAANLHERSDREADAS